MATDNVSPELRSAQDERVREAYGSIPGVFKVDLAKIPDLTIVVITAYRGWVTETTREARDLLRRIDPEREHYRFLVVPSLEESARHPAHRHASRPGRRESLYEALTSEATEWRQVGSIQEQMPQDMLPLIKRMVTSLNQHQHQRLQRIANLEEQVSQIEHLLSVGLMTYQSEESM